MLADFLAPIDLDLVIDIEVPTTQVLRRLAARRVCVDCGANYSLSSPPLINWTCDVCGGEVIQREDDTEEAIDAAPRDLRDPDRPAHRLVPGPRTSWPRCPAPARPTPSPGGSSGPSRPRNRKGGRMTGPYDDGMSDAVPSPLPAGDADEAQRRRAGQDAQGRPGGRRDPRGHPGRHQARASPPPTSTRRPARCWRSGAPGSNFLGYHGFPAVVCTSPNSMIVHGIPSPRGGAGRGRHHLASTAGPSSRATTGTPPTPRGWGRSRPRPPG